MRSRILLSICFLIGAACGGGAPSTPDGGGPPTSIDASIDASPDDPCSVGNGGCDPHATCAANAGKAVCTCATGYAGDGTSCTAIDACATANGGCDPHATCTSTGPGTRSCACDPGYTGDGTACAPPGLCAPVPAPPVADVGKACSAGSNQPVCAVDDKTCASGTCLFDVTSPIAYCTAACDQGDPAACPSGFACIHQLCSGDPATVCARVETTTNDCISFARNDVIVSDDWFGAMPDGFEYAYVLEPYSDRNEFWSHPNGASSWSTVLQIPNTSLETGTVQGIMYEATRVSDGASTYVAFGLGVYRFAGGGVVAQAVGGAGQQVLGVFRTSAGAIRAFVKASDGAIRIYERVTDAMWMPGAAVAHAITGVGALEDHGVLAVCDGALCAGDTGEDLAQLALPAGQVFGGLHVRKPLYVGKTPDDFMLLTRGGKVLRRRGGAFVADALAYTAPSDDGWGISGFTRNGAATYLFIGHANAPGADTFRLDGDCWRWVSAPLSPLVWGASDGTMHFLDEDAQVTCALRAP